MGLGISNATPPPVFIPCQSNFMRTLATMVKYRLLLFLPSGQGVKNFWHLAHGSQWENLKFEIS